MVFEELVYGENIAVVSDGYPLIENVENFLSLRIVSGFRDFVDKFLKHTDIQILLDEIP